MNPLNPTTVSRIEFRQALNLRCHKELGVGLRDLPDIINLDDVWWDGITTKETEQMIDGCIDDFRDEMGYTPIHTITARPTDSVTYTSIDE